MKKLRLVIGIISIVLCAYIFYQSRIARIYGSIFNSNDISGIGGFGVAALLLVAGIISIVARDSKRGGIIAGIFYILAALLGFYSIGIYRDLEVWSIVSFIFGIVFIVGSLTQKDDYDSGDNLSYGDTFIFDDFEISFEPAEWGADKNVINFPVKIKNLSYKLRELNSLYYKIYTPNGTEAQRVGVDFFDDISKIGNINTEITVYTYIRILYEGNGNYHAEFSNPDETIVIDLSV